MKNGAWSLLHAPFSKDGGINVNKKKIYPQWFLILPLTLYILFFLFPSLLGVLYSFTDWCARSSVNGLKFVGLDNYIEIFTSKKNYADGIYNTLRFTLISNIVKLIAIFFMLSHHLFSNNPYHLTANINYFPLSEGIVFAISTMGRICINFFVYTFHDF